MNCTVALEFLNPYFDGELDVNAAFQVRSHLSTCEACSAHLRGLQSQRESIRTADLVHELPPELEARIRRSLQRGRRTSIEWRTWGALAAGILLTGTLSVRLLENRSAAQGQLADEVISTHVHAMMTGHTSDVISTDRHTVKPWFDGRIDFSPPVKDLVEKGFPLVGGRVDYLDGHSVAALVYQRRKHVIDLYVWPAPAPGGDGNQSSRGYNVVRWDSAGMSFAAVSDVSDAELALFRNEFRKN